MEEEEGELNQLGKCISTVNLLLLWRSRDCVDVGIGTGQGRGSRKLVPIQRPHQAIHARQGMNSLLP